MRKLIAKTIIGKEYMHSRSDAYFVDKNADKICDTLNTAKYKLKEGECWYVYDYDFTQDWYVEQIISLTRTGKIKLSYI
jgi:hypothetical protein